MTGMNYLRCTHRFLLVGLTVRARMEAVTSWVNRKIKGGWGRWRADEDSLFVFLSLSCGRAHMTWRLCSYPSPTGRVSGALCSSYPPQSSLLDVLLALLVGWYIYFEYRHPPWKTVSIFKVWQTGCWMCWWRQLGPSRSMFHFHCPRFVIYLIRFKFALNPFENFSKFNELNNDVGKYDKNKIWCKNDNYYCMMDGQTWWSWDVSETYI